VVGIPFAVDGGATPIVISGIDPVAWIMVVTSGVAESDGAGDEEERPVSLVGLVLLGDGEAGSLTPTVFTAFMSSALLSNTGFPRSTERRPFRNAGEAKAAGLCGVLGGEPGSLVSNEGVYECRLDLGL
jgi:hypothetical protein